MCSEDLVEALLCDDAATVASAKSTMRRALNPVTDGVASLLADEICNDKSRKVRAILLLGQFDGAVFGRESYEKLDAALKQAHQAKDLEVQAAAQQVVGIFLRTGHDRQYARKAGPTEIPTALWRRILSVFGRPWVLVMLPFLGFIAGAASSMSHAGIWMTAIAMALVVIAVVFLDAARRRCPNCKRFLAGHLLQIVADGTYETHTTVGDLEVTEVNNLHTHAWKCVHCGTVWKTEQSRW